MPAQDTGDELGIALNWEDLGWCGIVSVDAIIVLPRGSTQLPDAQVKTDILCAPFGGVSLAEALEWDRS